MNLVSSMDVNFMKRALELSKKARVIAPPNPWVGCLIVSQGEVIGEGFTQQPGGAHAEIVALNQAKGRTKGATLYVTLEPCAHFGRTPPCANALIEAGIARVVIGITDPDELVRGRGIVCLREAGIEVVEGILSEDISQVLAPYLFHRTTGLPYCVLKGAISVDGRIAAKDYTSQWISGSESNVDSHHLRSECQAIIVGSGTVLADKPALTVREVPQFPSSPPLRVILDATGRVHPTGSLFDTSIAPTMVFTTVKCSEQVKESWKSHGALVEIVSEGRQGFGVDLKQVLYILGKRGILQVMIEGGGVLFGAFLRDQIAQQLRLYVGGCVLGSGGIPLFATDAIETLKEAPKLRLMDAKILGNDIRLDYALNDRSRK